MTPSAEHDLSRDALAETAGDLTLQHHEGHDRSPGGMTRRAFLTTGTAAGTGLAAGACLWGAENAGACSAHLADVGDPLIGRMGAVGSLAYDGRQPLNPLHFCQRVQRQRIPQLAPGSVLSTLDLEPRPDAPRVPIVTLDSRRSLLVEAHWTALG